MKHQQTTVSEATVRIRYAGDPDPAKATEWLEFEVPLASLTLPSPRGSVPLGDPDQADVGEVRKAALLHAAGLIGDALKTIHVRVRW